MNITSIKRLAEKDGGPCAVPTTLSQQSWHALH
jgi:hypothetical protein